MNRLSQILFKHSPKWSGSRLQSVHLHQSIKQSTRSLSTSTESDLVLEERDQVFWIRLNRPKQLNSMTPQMYEGVVDALQNAAKNPNVKFTVITGTGKYFSSGNDMANFSRMTQGAIEEAIQDETARYEKFINSFIDFPKPLIGVINGPAFGVMFTTLALYDCVIASDQAFFSAPFSSLGIVPEGCSTYTFPKIFGPSLANELMYFNYTLKAEEAFRRGFVSRIMPPEQLDSHVQEWLYGEKGLVKSCFPNSMFNAKAIVRNEDIKRELHKTNRIEANALHVAFRSDEFKQGLQKFFDKKKNK